MKKMNILRKPFGVILCDDNMPNNLTTNEWKFLEALVSSLEPLKELMCGKNYSPLSLCLFTGLINILKAHTLKTTTANEICQKLGNELKVILFFILPK